MNPAPRRIAVLRPRAIGGLLRATPALRALGAAWPDAELTLIGLPRTEALARRLPYVDRFVPFPGCPGVAGTDDLEGLRAFIVQMRAERFDLLLQMHGGGRVINPLVAACGAARSVGFAEHGAFSPRPEDYLPWPRHGDEAERLLRLIDHLGLPRRGPQLEFPLHDDDVRTLERLWPGHAHDAPYVCVHPGARVHARRWPAQHFAHVADAIVERGFRVVLSGDAADAPRADLVQALMRRPALNLAGRTDLWTLGALLRGARLLVCNDDGIADIAAALRTPTVVVPATRAVAPNRVVRASEWRLLADTAA